MGSESRDRPRFLGWASAEVFFILSVLQAVLFAILAGDITQSLDLDASQLGLLSGVFFVTYAVGQLVFGTLLSSIPVRVLLSVTALISAVGILIFALSSGLTTAIIARALAGIGLSSSFVGVIHVVSRDFGEQFAFMSSLSQSLSNVCASLLAMLSAVLLFLAGFRTPFLVTGLLLAVTAALLFFCLRAPSGFATPPSRGPGVRAALGQCLSNGQLWAAMVYYAGLFGTLLAFANLWNIQFQVRYFGHSIEKSSMMNAMIPLGVTVGSIVAGLWAGRAGFILPARIYGLFSLALFVLLLLVPLPASLAAGAMFCIGFGLSGSILALTAVQKHLPKAARPLGTALVVTAAFVLGGVIQPLVGATLGAARRIAELPALTTSTTPEFSAYQGGLLWILGAVTFAVLASFFFKPTKPAMKRTGLHFWHQLSID